MASKRIVIDGQKLREIFEKRKVTLGDVSKSCGFESSYFSKATKENKLPLYAIKLLEDRYHINYDEYKIEEVLEVKEKELPVIVESRVVEFIISEETAKQLHALIYSAVYEAVKRVWSE